MSDFKNCFRFISPATMQILIMCKDYLSFPLAYNELMLWEKSLSKYDYALVVQSALEYKCKRNKEVLSEIEKYCNEYEEKQKQKQKPKEKVTAEDILAQLNQMIEEEKKKAKERKKKEEEPEDIPF